MEIYPICCRLLTRSKLSALRFADNNNPHIDEVLDSWRSRLTSIVQPEIRTRLTRCLYPLYIKYVFDTYPKSI